MKKTVMKSERAYASPETEEIAVRFEMNVLTTGGGGGGTGETGQGGDDQEP